MMKNLREVVEEEVGDSGNVIRVSVGDSAGAQAG